MREEMVDQLDGFLNKLRLNPKIGTFDEASTKQAIILPVLGFLGWCTYDVDEVVPEYTVENRRIDYSLRINNSNEFFIEAKGASEDLEKHEEQLLDYSFRQGVQLATLTNGITWWFYLPMKKGDWKTRKFYTIDILKQEPEDVVDKFVELLSKDTVKTGKALKNAESIYKSRLKENTLMETLPEAWNTIITEPDALLIDLIAETTERLCGFKPETDDVKRFITRMTPHILTPVIAAEEKSHKMKDSLKFDETTIVKKERRDKKTWRIAVMEAIERVCSRRQSKIFDRQTLIEEELGQIIRDTKTEGATPRQTLSRVLQQLREQGDIKFLDRRGTYQFLR